MAVAPNDPRYALAGLRARAARLGEALYGVETEPEFRLLRDPSQLAGQSATVAAEAKARIDRLWQHYPTSPTPSTDSNERSPRTTGPSATGCWDHPRSPSPTARPPHPGLLAALETDLDPSGRSPPGGCGDGGGRLLPRDRPARCRAVGRLTDVAADLDCRCRPRPRRPPGRLTDGLRARRADPLGIDTQPAETAVERARRHIDGLARPAAELPDDLAAARAPAGRVRASSSIGRWPRRWHTSRAEVGRPDGLLRPLDPSALDGDDRALGPWLDRIDGLADRGDWRRPSTGLARWRNGRRRLD